MNLPSLFFLNRLAKRKKAKAHASSVEADTTEPQTHARKKLKVANWLVRTPEPIALFPAEKEIYKKGLVLVTDTRIAFIDPFDNMLKTFMFEHMISLHKQFYRATKLNAFFCKTLIILSLVMLLIILIIDMVDTGTSGFFLIYLPLIVCLLIGVKAWIDMKPKYAIHWRMRDLTYGEIVTESTFGEYFLGSRKREQFMADLADAMNYALANKSWWPSNTVDKPTAASVPDTPTPDDKPPELKLVTENYQ